MIHILTGEYPPVRGGVADYTALVAEALSQRGARVHVWTGGDEGAHLEGAVWIHRVAMDFGYAGLRNLDREWRNGQELRRLIVQWTPHSFGMRSVNLPLAVWLWNRARLGDRIELMVHEPFLAFGEGNLRQDAAAVVQRAMMLLLLDAAWHVRVAIPAWERSLRPWRLGRRPEFEWAPVPSNISECPDLRDVLRSRAELTTSGEAIVGHFGTFRKDVANLLAPALKELLRCTTLRVLLIGRGSDEFAIDFAAGNTDLDRRIMSTGELSAADAAIALSACDVLLQPYPDGISTRRGTAMAAMALGIPLVSNLGRLSEERWRATDAAHLTESTNAPMLAAAVLEVLNDRELRTTLSANARRVYQQNFSLVHTVDSLLRVYGDAAPDLRAAHV